MPQGHPSLESETVTREETRLAPRHRVLIHNDDATPMDFVVHVLQEVFKLPLFRSIRIMLEAHRGGVAHVVTEPLERAEFHVDQARSLARGRGWPLSFSIEPE
jgi:ATP-dependent Clp protease adaptor protein ClpS